jgi:hypothetical protein
MQTRNTPATLTTRYNGVMSEQSDKLGRQCFTGPLMLVVFVAF